MQEFTNITVKNCKSFPYYSADNVTDGERVLRNGIKSGVEQLRSCFESNTNVHQFLTDKLDHITDILMSEEEKTFECSYGKYNSFFALASFPEDHKSAEKNKRYEMAPHPSMLLDINRMAGNFPLNMDEQQRDKMLSFYGGKLRLDEIESGKRNPFFGKIENPTSLVVHEMLHWTESYHSDKNYPDFVYLSQVCCFKINNVESDVQDRACEILFNEEYWQNDEVRRKEAMNNDEIRKEVSGIIRKYHTHKVHLNRMQSADIFGIPFLRLGRFSSTQYVHDGLRCER